MTQTSVAILKENFENVRRSALVLHPRKPFFEGIDRVAPGAITLELEGDVYLLPDFEELEDMRRWLVRNFDALFTDQLNNWYIDRRAWPKNRTFPMFQDWFSCSLYTMIWDTLGSPVHKDGPRPSGIFPVSVRPGRTSAFFRGVRSAHPDLSPASGTSDRRKAHVGRPPAL